MRKSRRMHDIPMSGVLKDGRANEDRVERLLHELAMEGEIHHYQRSEPGGELDRKGIDFLVFPEEDWIIPLQVKSSVKGREDHEERYGKSIPCIVVFTDQDDRHLKEWIMRVMGLSIQGLLPQNPTVTV